MGRTTSALLLTATALAAAGFARRRSRRLDLRGKTVLITGGSRGLGLVLAREFARRGARVAICARDPEELHRAKEDISTYGSPAFALTCDVSQREQVDELVRRVTEVFGPVDILVNNAGVVQVGPAETMTLEDYEQAMGVHFWGALHTSLAVLPEMYRRRAGRIVNITSIGGEIPVPHMLPYTASKYALVGLSEGLRSELLKNRIYVTTVVPGLMRTGSPPNAQFKGHTGAEYTWFAISDSAPGLSMAAERAARSIIEACRVGRAHLVLSLPAKLATLAHAVAPGTVADAMGLVNRFLPGPGGLATRTRPGSAARPDWLPDWATAPTDRAARRNNE